MKFETRYECESCNVEWKIEWQSFRPNHPTGMPLIRACPDCARYIWLDPEKRPKTWGRLTKQTYRVWRWWEFIERWSR